MSIPAFAPYVPMDVTPSRKGSTLLRGIRAIRGFFAPSSSQPISLQPDSPQPNSLLNAYAPEFAPISPERPQDTRLPPIVDLQSVSGELQDHPAPAPMGEGPENRTRRLFVRSGGGMPGLDIHAGIWLALERAGIVATDCWGTSAGAAVSAFDASGLAAGTVEEILRDLDDIDIRDERFAWKLRIPWLDYYLRPGPILDLLQWHLPGHWDFYAKPLHVYATNAATGYATTMRDAFSDPARAVLASMSICGAFPPVKGDDGFLYFDGGVDANLPAPAVPEIATGYDEIWLLVASGAPRGYTRNDRMLTRLIQSARWMMHNQILDSIADCRRAAEITGKTKVRVIWPALAAPRGVLHFDHDLIAQAYEWTAKQLQQEAEA